MLLKAVSSKRKKGLVRPFLISRQNYELLNFFFRQHQRNVQIFKLLRINV